MGTEAFFMVDTRGWVALPVEGDGEQTLSPVEGKKGH